MQNSCDELLKIVFPPVLNYDFHDFILDDGYVSSFEQWSPSPFPTTSDEITQGVGQLDINSTAELNSTAMTAQKPEKQRGRPRKPISKEESQSRQRAANGRKRKTKKTYFKRRITE